jgi:hypothetical protein
MADDKAARTLRRLTTPHSAALAGVVFAVLCGTSILLMAVLPRDPGSDSEWIRQGDSQIRLALTLTPFAGIAFLWFMGVVRDRFGELEDRFFSTVFFGSGLLFLAMYFAAMSVAGGLVSSPAAAPAYTVEVVRFGRSVMLQTFNVFALKMAGAFMISLGTMWLRTGLMPRWLAVVTWLGAGVLILTVSQNLYLFLVFPGWVLLVSLVHLLRARLGLVVDAG